MITIITLIIRSVGISHLFTSNQATRANMPCLKILTNLPRSEIPNDFVNKILPLLARVVRKPESVSKHNITYFIIIVFYEKFFHVFLGDKNVSTFDV